jgi:hypothetical protein
MKAPKHYQEARYWRLRAEAHRADANAYAANPYLEPAMASTFASHLMAMSVLADREADEHEKQMWTDERTAAE